MKAIIVEDSPETRHRLLGLIAQIDGIDVVGLADDAETGMLLAKAHRPTLAIVGLHLDDGRGVDVIQTIKQAHPLSDVVALADHTSAEHRIDGLFEKMTSSRLHSRT